MTPEQLVPTLETCIHAKDRGYPQGKSFFVWVRDGIGNWKLVVNIMLFYAEEKVDAPTLQELLVELLPSFIDKDEKVNLFCLTLVDSERGYWEYNVGYRDFDTEKWSLGLTKTNPAEAAALLWLELQKKREQ